MSLLSTIDSPEQLLIDLGCRIRRDYTRQPDGTLLVSASISIWLVDRPLIELPDYSRIHFGGAFHCFRSGLTSLKGAPASVGGIFDCSQNPLTSLEHAPKIFKKLYSDFGNFDSWDDVPEELRLSPETRQRREMQESQDLRNQITLALRQPVPSPRPMRLIRQKRP